MFLCDFRAGTQNTVIDAALFRDSDCFYRAIPPCAAFDRVTRCVLFLAMNKETNRFRVVAADSEKRIIAVGEECPIPYENWNTTHISLVPGGCMAGFSVYSGDGEYRENGVNSMFYLAQFHRENGRIVFDET